MHESRWRWVVCCVLIILLPGSLIAADTAAAMVYTNGAAWINGGDVPRSSSAIFVGDLLQTRSDSIANINQPGSTITVLADSLVKFEGSSLQIEHGAVTVSTSRGVSTSAGDVKVTPVSNAWTEFNVMDVDGTVRIAARKGDLKISSGKETTLLAQGQETTLNESSGSGGSKHKGTPSAAASPATDGILNSPWAVAAGGAAGTYLLVRWVIRPPEDPASPWKPQ